MRLPSESGSSSAVAEHSGGSPTGAAQRKLSLLDATLLTMGGIIGVGIFFNPQQSAALVPQPLAFLSLWVFGGLIALIVIDLADTAAKGLDHLLDIGLGYATMRTFLLIGSLAAIRTERRAFHLPFALVSLVWMAAFFWIYRPVIADAGL